MIDNLSIISNGGVVLWETNSNSSGMRLMVNRVIQEVLLEDRAGVHELVIGEYKLHWALENNAQFFAVCVYPKFLSYPFIDLFMRGIVKVFARKYGCVQDNLFGEYDFTEEYAEALSTLDSGGKNDVNAAQCGAVLEDDIYDATMEAEEIEEGATGGEEEEGAVTRRGDNTIVTKGGQIIMRKGKRVITGSKSALSQTTQKKGKSVKQATRWDDVSVDPAVNEQEKQRGGPTQEELNAQTEMQRTAFIKRLPNGSIAPIREEEWENQPRGRLATWLRSYIGCRELDVQDFQRVIPGLREKLITKNVAVEVAEHLCKSVETSLDGVKLGTFESLHKSIENAMISALYRILQPKHEVNILRAVASAKTRKRPYSIVFCGVNGVGKSTTLAKVAYWLQQNGHSVMIAAGDTFRHGAVEQLEVHGRCLGVPVFQMGYGTDPSAVAAAAIGHAARQQCDVVMIDTAGRMQDHESRMRALAKLIHDNQPDMVLFVGEALVGNIGVDQLRRFNQCLIDFAPVGTVPRGIDGIVLTKFDTIDDKVGAAISMVYELGQPIVFVGCGQTYQDLKVMRPDVIVSALMA